MSSAHSSRLDDAAEEEWGLGAIQMDTDPVEWDEFGNYRRQQRPATPTAADQMGSTDEVVEEEGEEENNEVIRLKIYRSSSAAAAAADWLWIKVRDPGHVDQLQMWHPHNRGGPAEITRK